MDSVVVQGEKIIAQPLEVVQAQFTDMGHHHSTGVHKDLDVSNVRLLDNGCVFTGRRRVFGMLQQDEIEVQRRADGSSTLLLAPLVRMGLERDLKNALEEDRYDLEERGYPRSHPNPGS